MKYLKTFENFDDFSNSDSDEQEWIDHRKRVTAKSENEFESDDTDDENFDEDDVEEKVWGDEEVVEKKKLPEGLRKAIEAKKAKSKGKEEKTDKKEDTKKSGKGLTTAQKKLPAGLQKAILSKKK